ncbi:MAG: hypothetical protein GY796_32165 [Chloroflexi bacterium]|nr:hypothetical protein [Chloroflexota bacterium]
MVRYRSTNTLPSNRLALIWLGGTSAVPQNWMTGARGRGNRRKGILFGEGYIRLPRPYDNDTCWVGARRLGITPVIHRNRVTNRFALVRLGIGW